MRPTYRFTLAVALVVCLAACSGASRSERTSGTGGAGASGTTATGGSAAGGGGAAAGNGEIGDACATNGDCTAVPGAECWTTIGGGPVPTITFPGGFCSKACDTSSTVNECGDVAGCASVGVSGGQGSVTLSMCVPPCATNAECRSTEGYHCQLVLPGIGYCALD